MIGTGFGKRSTISGTSVPICNDALHGRGRAGAAPTARAAYNEVLEVGSTTSLRRGVDLASYPDYLSIRDSSRSFRGTAAIAFIPAGFSLRPEALPQLKMAAAVNAGFFDALEVTPTLGRGFSPQEDSVPGRDAVVVLSHDLWAQELAADSSILGRKIHLNGIEFTVIGWRRSVSPG